MTIRGVGIDIVDIPRFRRVWARYGPSLERRWFDASEVDTQGDTARQLARCLAVKEAVWKALAPTAPAHLVWNEIITTRSSAGALGVELRGGLLLAADLIGVESILVSATTQGDLVVATAIAQGAEP